MISLHGARVVLRPWLAGDLPAFARLNADEDVMAYFPARLTAEESDALAERIGAGFKSRGWGLWALHLPKPAGAAPAGFCGFVGLAPVPQDVAEAARLPAGAVEIGWRLAAAAWHQGFASEAASLALGFALDVLRLSAVYSFTAVGNLPSQAVMRRIGLLPCGHFGHPRFDREHPLHGHVLYATAGEGAARALPAAASQPF